MFKIPSLKITILFFGFICFTSCDTVTTKENMDISLEASEHPIILRYNKEHEYIWRIDIPIKTRLTNSSFLRKTLNRVNYNYDKSMEYHSNIHNKNNIRVPIYVEIDGKLKKPPKYKGIYYNEVKEYILYPYTKLDTIQNNQTMYQKYIAIMQQNNTDSLAIGTIKELSRKDPELLAQLHKGVLYFEFRKNKSVQVEEISKDILRTDLE